MERMNDNGTPVSIVDPTCLLACLLAQYPCIVVPLMRFGLFSHQGISLSATARQSGSGFFFEVFLAARYVVFWERIAGGIILVPRRVFLWGKDNSKLCLLGLYGMFGYLVP
jgi:hypothetical protein